MLVFISTSVTFPTTIDFYMNDRDRYVFVDSTSISLLNSYTVTNMDCLHRI